MVTVDADNLQGGTIGGDEITEITAGGDVVWPNGPRYFDVYFVCDRSGSMDGSLIDLRADVEEMISAFGNSSRDHWLGLVNYESIITYSTYAGSDYSIISNNLPTVGDGGSDVDSAMDKVQNLDSSYGREDAAPVVILLADINSDGTTVEYVHNAGGYSISFGYDSELNGSFDKRYIGGQGNGSDAVNYLENQLN